MEKPNTARRPVSTAGRRRATASRTPPPGARPYVVVRTGPGGERRVLLYPAGAPLPPRARAGHPRSSGRRPRGRARERRLPRLRGRLSRKVVLWATLATLGAAVLGGPWGSPLLTDVRAMLPTSSFFKQSGTAAAAAGSPTAAQAQAVVDAAVAKLVTGRPRDSLSLAAVDTTTEVQVASHADTSMTAASVFKLALLEGYLLRNQDRGQAPGDGLSGALAAMIEHSNNDSADEVYLALQGATGIRAVLPRLGVQATALGPDGQWGLSTTTAADQLKLLANLVSDGSPLTAESRAYALRLLHDVEDDQRWGVGAAADPGAGFANKNGWLEVDADGDRWAVGSVGVIGVGGHQVLIAVLSQHGADQSDGVDLVESASLAVARALHPTASHR